jgi:tungstate transport system substrate-binding protein
MWRTLISAILISATAQSATAQARSVQVGATALLEESGLMAHLSQRFATATGIAVDVTPKRSAEVIVLAQRGHLDLVIVNNPEASQAFVESGEGLPGRAIMTDPFVIVGPAEDPANVRHAPDFASALVAIARERAPFVSRGDGSRTHLVELALWASAGVDPKKRSGSWYRETGRGTADALRTAAQLKAYTFANRATWLASGVAGTLPVLQERNPPLNRYVAMTVNPARYPSRRTAEAQLLVDWLVSPGGQDAIRDYIVGGERPFMPDAKGGS